MQSKAFSMEDLFAFLTPVSARSTLRRPRGHSGSRGLPELPGERGMAPCARRQILHHPQRLGHSGLADAQRPAHRLARRSQPQ